MPDSSLALIVFVNCFACGQKLKIIKTSTDGPGIFKLEVDRCESCRREAIEDGPRKP